MLDQTPPASASSSRFTAMGIDSGLLIVVVGGGGGGGGGGGVGDYSSEAINVNISIKVGRLFEGGD